MYTSIINSKKSVYYHVFHLYITSKITGTHVTVFLFFFTALTHVNYQRYFIEICV